MPPRRADTAPEEGAHGQSLRVEGEGEMSCDEMVRLQRDLWQNPAQECVEVDDVSG